jgi:hypothetical protein
MGKELCEMRGVKLFLASVILCGVALAVFYVAPLSIKTEQVDVEKLRIEAYKRALRGGVEE